VNETNNHQMDHRLVFQNPVFKQRKHPLNKAEASPAQGMR